MDKKSRIEIKEFADSHDVDICAVESMSNFISPVMEQRENNLAMMKDVLELARDLDVDIVKVFAAWPGVRWELGEVADYEPYDLIQNTSSREYVRQWRYAREGIREVANWAKDSGITIALQNHPSLIRPGCEGALSMVREAGMENVKLCLDVPLFFDRQSDEYIRESVERCGNLIAPSHYGAWNFEERGGEVFQEPWRLAGKPINYETFVRELRKIGYKGYLVQELCSPVIRDHEYLGIEEVNRKTRLALRYMKKSIAKV